MAELNQQAQLIEQLRFDSDALYSYEEGSAPKYELNISVYDCRDVVVLPAHFIKRAGQAILRYVRKCASTLETSSRHRD